MYTIKERVPKIEPCGTSVATGIIEEWISSMLTNWMPLLYVHLCDP